MYLINPVKYDSQNQTGETEPSMKQPIFILPLNLTSVNASEIGQSADFILVSQSVASGRISAPVTSIWKLFPRCFASFLFKHNNSQKPSRYLSSPPPLWPWPSCKQPKTDSFRDAGTVRRTVNSVYLDSAESCFTRSPTSDEPDQSLTTASEDDSVEMVVRGLRSADRLFSRPGGDTNSILDEAKEASGEDLPFEGSVALALESDDPQADFRRSMEEVVAAHGVRDWKRLEALLVWYLRANGKKAHEFIFEAFVDLLVRLACPNSPVSSSSSTSSSASIEIVEIKEDEGMLVT